MIKQYYRLSIHDSLRYTIIVTQKFTYSQTFQKQNEIIFMKRLKWRREKLT